MASNSCLCARIFLKLKIYILKRERRKVSYRVDFKIKAAL